MIYILLMVFKIPHIIGILKCKGMNGMAYVISLQRPMASGKTTLAKSLELHGLSVIYENPYPIVEKRKQLNLDMNSKEGFIANQKMFIEAKIKEFQNAKGSVVIFDRGPEDIEFYTIFYPTTIGKEWDIETELKDELYKLRECRSDAIFIWMYWKVIYMIEKIMIEQETEVHLRSNLN